MGIMNDYLAITRKRLQTKAYAGLNIVIGNVSCDLDSAVSALVYAVFLNWQYEKIQCNVCTKGKRDERQIRDDIFVPILNVDREDYALKTEVVYLLKECGVESSNLIFRNDFDIEQLLKSSNSKVVLVDHHVLSSKDVFLAPYVTEIIDHRPLDKTGWVYKDDTRTTIELVGSCSTLVAQRIKDLSSLFAKDVEFFNTHPVCANMLHSTVIVDTVNLSKTFNKATPHDEEILIFLESFIKINDCEIDRQTKLDKLTEARSDVSELTAVQLLRKDVKIVGDILVPTFPTLVQEFLQRPDALDALSITLSKMECTLAVMIGIELKDKNKMMRDLAVYSPDTTRATRISTFLQDWNKPRFELSLPTEKTHCIYFQQSNLSATRKQYIPAIKEFLNI